MAGSPSQPCQGGRKGADSQTEGWQEAQVSLVKEGRRVQTHILRDGRKPKSALSRRKGADSHTEGWQEAQVSLVKEGGRVQTHKLRDGRKPKSALSRREEGCRLTS